MIITGKTNRRLRCTVEFTLVLCSRIAVFQLANFLFEGSEFGFFTRDETLHVTDGFGER